LSIRESIIKRFAEAPTALRWLGLMAALTAGVVLFISLPQTITVPVFTAVVGLSAMSLIRAAWLKREGKSRLLVSSRTSTAVLTAVAILLMIASAYVFRPESINPQSTGLLLMLLGGLFLLAALRLSRAPALWPLSSADAIPVTMTSLVGGDYIKIAIGLTSLVLLTLRNLSLPPDWVPDLSHHVQFVLLGVGMLLPVWGLSGMRWMQVRAALRSPFRPENRAILLITLLAFALQLWMLEDAVHVFVDEFHNMNAVLGLWTRTDIQILTPYGYMTSFPWVFPYLQSGAIALFGKTYFGIRFVSVIFGTLAIPALYRLAKELFDRRTALIAALLLASFPPHIHLSRLGMINVADPLIGTLLLVFLARGLQTRSRIDYVLAGACLGMTQYFYEGGKLLFPALALLWLAVIALFRREQFSLRGVGYLLLTAVIVALPMYSAWASWGFSFSPRMDEMGSTGLDWGAILSLINGAAALQTYLSKNLIPPLLHLVHLPDTSGFYYGGDTALILGYLQPLFFLGIFHALWRWRIAGVMPLLWIALTVFGNSLLLPVMTAWPPRFQVVFPAIAVLIAVGLRYSLPMFTPLWSANASPERVNTRRRFKPHVWLAGIGVIALAMLQPLYYFRDHLPVYNVQVRPYYDHIDAYDRARLLPPDTAMVFLTDDIVFVDHIHTLAAFWDFHPAMNVIDSVAFTPDYLAALPPEGQAFFIDPHNALAPGLLRATFGDRMEGPQFSPYNVPLSRQYALYYLPPRTP
jgi:4-amino-4-deoxy-L-arabinose transferase-like glycosyltransferase